MQAVPDPAAPALGSTGFQPSPAQRLSLLNAWQRGFPLCDEPFAVVGAALDLSAAQVLQAYRQLAREGALSRIGAVFAPGSGGASILSAMAVPPERLEAVAAVVSAHPGVNHNYERENAYNLWFVVTGPSAAQVECTIASLEADTGLTALRLPMLQPYRIDLAFDLSSELTTGPQHAAQVGSCALQPPQVAPRAQLADADWPLAALAEAGVADYTRASTRITAIAADALLALHLRLSPGAPLLRSVAINVDAAGLPIEFGTTWFAGDRVALTVMADQLS